MIRKAALKKLVKYPLIALLMIGIYLGGLQLVGNFHEVVSGEVYRSAQLSGKSFVNYSKEYKIRTIINLRGDNTGEDWYDDEVASSKKNNINHIDFRMSARRGLTQGEALNLIEIMKNAPKPILLHCKSGADRSGLAAALYLAAISQKDEFSAEMELSPLYGHIWFGAPAMDDTFELMEPLLGYNKS